MLTSPTSPVLVLINGAPGSGKSTLARLLAAEWPGAVVLDVDSMRATLAHWQDDPIAAGHTARRRALRAASEQLVAGHAVLVPQFLQRPQFADELADVATAAGARFVETCLVSSPAEAARRFAARHGSTDPNHVAARWLQSRPDAPGIANAYRAMLRMVRARPATVEVRSVAGNVDATLARLRSAISAASGAG